MERTVTVACLVSTSLLLWFALGFLIVVADVGSAAALDARRIAACVLLVAAPAATFVPLARWMSARLYVIEALAGWGCCAGMLAFVRPSSPPSIGQFLLFLVSLTVALATIGSLASYLVGLRVYRRDARRHDFVRARRQGYLAALLIVGLMLLHSVGTLSAATAFLLLAIVALAESLALTRARARPDGARRQDALPRSG